MNNASALLPLLKIDLGVKTDAYDTRFTQYLEAAQQAIEREGVTLTDSVEDDQLVVMYAAWLWRKRDFPPGNATQGDKMPRMIRYALNNRVYSQKMGAEDG